VASQYFANLPGLYYISMDTLIDAIFQDHYNYYNTVGVETIKQQAGQVEQVSSDYEGRVIYELLQNAFDKATGRIKVMVKNGYLYIANDGQPFTYLSGYNYKEGSEKRGDFQALCSISTSDKNVNTSIGNKGVGFKSVFFVADGGFVDIHTKGEIIGKRSNRQPALVSFRVYDTFMDSSYIPKQLPKTERAKLKELINKTNRYNKNKGVPGYYYPIQLEDRDNNAEQLFTDGYVTIIQMKLSERGMKQVAGFFADIKLVNFHFIQLRVPHLVLTLFEFEGRDELNFTKDLKVKTPGRYFACPVNNKVKELAKAAKINLDAPMVSVYFKPALDEINGPGKLYNYLPTDLHSPFPWADFHGDFHTTVDRTGMNWVGEVGAYNKALLEACVELYFEVISMQLGKSSQLPLHFGYLDYANLQDTAGFNFRWTYLLPHSDQHLTYPMVRGTLGIDTGKYEEACMLIARLAKQFFGNGIARHKEAYNAFYQHTGRFIELFSRTSGNSLQYPKEFKKQLVEALRTASAPVIPGDGLREFSLQEEIIYREHWKDAEDSIIPAFIGLSITGYKVPDEEMEKLLGIKSTIVNNEVLKYYRQASPSGQVRERKEAYSEKQQKHLIISIAALIGKADGRLVCTHRYANYLISHTVNSVADQANFSLSTIFLRINDKSGGKRYKPAQLCTIDEVDLKFLPPLPTHMTQTYLLKYLGVSFSGNYRFVDRAIFDKLKNGLDYIPRIYKYPSEKADALNYAQVARDVRVVLKSKDVHPALINDNQYSFLTDWKRQDFLLESEQLLVKKYQQFPKNYLEHILNVLQRVPVTRNAERLKFYPLVFELLLRELKICMVAEQGHIKFVKTDIQVFIVNNEYEFRLSQMRKLNVLCFYTRKIDPNLHGLRGKVLTFKEQRLEVGGVENATPYFRELLEDRMFYLLLEIQRTGVATDYFQNPRRIGELAQKLGILKFEKADSIQREISSEYFNEPILDQRRYDSDGERLYLLKELGFAGQAEALALEFFENAQLAQTIELVLFLRPLSSLEQAAQKHQGLELEIFQTNWIMGFRQRFTKFVKKITDAFGVPYPTGDPNWYRYNKSHQSKLIQEASNNGRLRELKEIIAVERVRFEKGVFAYFRLEIEENMYDDAIAKLRLILQPLVGEAADRYRKKLAALVGNLGIERKLSDLETAINAAYPEAFAVPVSGQALQGQSEQVAVDANIEQIFQSIQNLKEKQQQNFIANTDYSVKPMPVKIKKVIFQGETKPGIGSEVTGAGGEVDVLFLMIQHFLLIPTAVERKRALKAVHQLVLDKSKKDSGTVTKHTAYYQTCLKNISNDEVLTKALIPFYYVTLHHKFAFVDLFAWYDGRAMMIEVKSTNTPGKNDFTISGSEVNEARATADYMIVRVTSEAIIFLGNPIYQVRDELTQVSGSNFEIVPTAYNFRYKQ
jgi:hypothetical protein